METDKVNQIGGDNPPRNKLVHRSLKDKRTEWRGIGFATLWQEDVAAI